MEHPAPLPQPPTSRRRTSASDVRRPHASGLGVGAPTRLLATVLLLSTAWTARPGTIRAQAVATGGSERIATTAAGAQYRAGLLQRWILGRHYRDLWTQPIQVEVLDLEATAGGLTPTRTGGGMQTQSLRFIGADGREYAFRSVDKDPSPVLDSILRGTVVADLVQDGISAAHPFGALVAAPLLDAVGVLHVNPQLRVMPDDPSLGEFRSQFAGMLGLIEERPDENDGERTSFEGTERVISSENLTERLEDGPEDRVDAEAYLTARITDVFLGDWDRHRGQWRWATYDTGESRRWLPVPRDRDQAFSKFDGLATRIVSLYMPQFVRFEEEYPAIRRLHWNARAIDRWFLAELDRDAWNRVGQEVQAALADDVISSAALQLPPEIYELNGDELQQTLRARRDRLPEAWAEFYELMAQKVDLFATDEDEVVRVERERDAFTVTITAPGTDSEPYVRRRFVSSETDEVRVYMQGGDDELTVVGDADTNMTLRVIGGGDDDRFVIEGRGSGVKLYDDKGRNTVVGDDAPRIETKDFNEWEWTPETRNQPLDWGRSVTPIFWTSYSTDLGLFLGGGARIEHYGFRKSPYSTAFDVRGGWSPFLSKGRVELSGEFRRENSALFTPVAARLSRLDVLHYYGLGNDTPAGDEAFHRVDLTRLSADLGLGLDFESGLAVRGGLRIERASTQENPGRFFDTVRPVYGDSAFVSLGLVGEAVFDPLADSRDTGHRFRIRAAGGAWPDLLDVDRLYSRLSVETSALLASSTWPVVSLAVRGGGEQVFGRFPWHQAAFVGGGATVRGWDEQRFAGDASLWGGAELRLRVLSPRIVVPVALGLFGFADAGRVWLNNDSPGGWHTGLGGGVYLQPVQQPYLVRIGAGSSDEATKIYLALGLPY